MEHDMKTRQTIFAFLAGLLAAGPAFAQSTTQPEVEVTASRLGQGITGAFTTVITEEEIARSPALTLQDILSRQPGVQVQHFFGGSNGARDSVDMRGFGAAASNNTLILLNGRRLNDVDLAGIDFAAIPRDAIERIEITRGNSGAVLYGDGAVGGVINIVTKTTPGTRPFRAEIAAGSWRHREASLSGRQQVGPISANIFGSYLDSANYRENNRLREATATADIRHQGEKGDLYLNISADDQDLGLPGARNVTLSRSQVDSDPRGTATPRDFGDKQGVNLTLGGTRMLAEGLELIIDGGVRDKQQQSAFFSAFGAGFDTYTHTSLTTVSLTPRMNAQHTLLGLNGKATGGVDVYWSIYDSDRMVHVGDAPNHRYDLGQRTIGVYGQETLAIRPDTDVSFGARLANLNVTARDFLDERAPGGAGGVRGAPLDDNSWDYALHLGAEHRLAKELALFGRFGRSIRLPNVDERVGNTPFGVPPTFALKTQTSRDMEGGARINFGGFELQSSAYMMYLENEVHFSPATFVNLNLDPTKRYGFENAASYQVLDDVTLRSALAYTNAKFRGGPFKGKEVPLVSKWTGNIGASWNIWGKYVVLDGDVRYVGSRRFDNDQSNFQPLIPAHALIDLKLGGEIGWAYWSFTVQNLLDKRYFDYGIASATTYGTYNAFPQPTRTLIGRVGVRF
jgi:iron complex outermembrane recepter protein